MSLAGQATLAADPSHAATTVSISGKVLAVSAAEGKANQIEICNALGLQISGDTRPAGRVPALVHRPWPWALSPTLTGSVGRLSKWDAS